MSALIFLCVIVFLSVGFHFALQHRLCALVGGLVPLLCVALAQLHVPFQMPVALVIAVFPFAVPFVFVASAFNPGTPLISVLPLIAFAAVLNTGYYALVARLVAWGWRRLATRPRPA